MNTRLANVNVNGRLVLLRVDHMHQLLHDTYHLNRRLRILTSLKADRLARLQGKARQQEARWARARAKANRKSNSCSTDEIGAMTIVIHD